jgi:hypothetical protein
VKLADDLLVKVIQVAAVGLLLKLNYDELLVRPWVLGAGVLCFIHMFIYHLNFHHILAPRKGSDAVFHWLVVFLACSIVLYPMTLNELFKRNFLPYTLVNTVACGLFSLTVLWARIRGWLTHANPAMRFWYTVAPWTATSYYGTLVWLVVHGRDVKWLCVIAPLFFANPPGRYLTNAEIAEGARQAA